MFQIPLSFSDEEIVPKYMDLLNIGSPEKIVFRVSFYDEIKEMEFENISSDFKDIKIIKATEVYCLFSQPGASSYSIIKWCKECLTIYHKLSEGSQSMHQDTLKLLKHFKQQYVDKLYQSFEMQPPNLTFNEHKFTPCEDDKDDLIHVLTILKHKIYGSCYTLETSKLSKERESIHFEIKSNKIIPIKKSRKRKGESDENDKPKKSLKRNFRTFRNPDMESCWLNSCMQLTLAALDHTEDVAANGSDLWELLIAHKTKDSEQILNPLNVRNILIEKERERISMNNILPENRLFHFAGTNTKSLRQLKLMSESSRIGQQDCKDFFICLQENNNNWMDVYNLLRFSTVESTRCTECDTVQGDFIPISRSFLQLDSPQEDMKISDYLAAQLNQTSTVTDWRHQDGCGRKVMGIHSFRIHNIDEVQFITIIVNRISYNLQGALTINNREIEVEPYVKIRGHDDKMVKFRPICVIYHIGHVIGNDTRGHYMADVLDVTSNRWFRTSDDEMPRPITNVADNGYIFLLKRVDE